MEPLGPRPGNPISDARIILPERRRRPRYKAHTPAYARLNSDFGKLTIDLSEILDINEDGIAIQAAPPLEANRPINLCIDLSETNTSIHTTGFVVWSHRSGRAGIRLPNLPDATRQQLREWLFLNALATCADSAGLKRAEDVGEAEQAPKNANAGGLPTFEIFPEEPSTAATRDLTTILTALDAVQTEVESLETNLEAALQLLAERAQAFTRSSGAAIALYPADVEPGASILNGNYMVCRARAGSDAPPVDAQLQVGTGFSGECIRSARLLRCDDSETDPYVDRDSCRYLGIRSILAAPIRNNGEVMGLLEVFSAAPYTFNDNDSKVMERLAEAAAIALTRSACPDVQEKASPWLPSDDSVEPLSTEDLSAARLHDQRLGGVPVHRAHLVFLLTVAALIALVLGFMVAPWVDSKWSRASVRPRLDQQANIGKTPGLKTVAEAITVDDLRKLAEQGDPTAQFALGAHYATGEDVQQNLAEAIPWFIRAAEQGNVAAQSALGAYYSVGRGVPHDVNKAYFWSILASVSGDETSKYRLPILTSRMTRAQIFAVQQEADNWMKRRQLATDSSAAH